MNTPWFEAELQGLLARRGRLPHALLIKGPQGIGKLGFAESLARAILCEKPAPANGRACGRCASCGWMAQAAHPDLMRLELAEASESGDGEEGGEKKSSRQITVEQIRGIGDFVHISSHRGGAKIILVHPAEALNPSAANALLKNLEEPPPATHFILVAHRWHQLLPTIRSRCQQVTLAPPPAEAAVRWLAEQGEKEAALALAHAGGAPMQAAKWGESYWSDRARFMDVICAREFDPLLAAEQLRDLAPSTVVAWLQKWSFDLASQKAAGQVRYNPDRAAVAGSLAARLELLEVLRYHREVVRLQRILSHPLNPRLFLEYLMLSYGALVRRQPGAAPA